MKIRTFTCLSAFVLCLFALSVQAQWTSSGGNNHAAGNVGIGTTAIPTAASVARLDVVKADGGAYTAVFRSAKTNDSYLYHVISPTYHLLGSSKNGTGLLRKIGFAIGTADGDADIKMTIDVNGNVGIGTKSPDAMLTVNGDVHATEVRVDVNMPAPDYVFEASYELMPLSVLAKYIKENKHLPEVPAGKELEEKGMNVSEMNMLLLKKVEELTLYLIDQQETHREAAKTLQQENDALRKRVEALEEALQN